MTIQRIQAHDRKGSTRMKVDVLQGHLARGLDQAARAKPKRATLPITASFQLETLEGRLRITASDLKTTVTVYVGAQVRQEGAVCLPIEVLQRGIKALPDEKVEIEVDDNLKATLTCAGRTLTINGQAAEDYPPTPSVDTLTTTVASDDLRQALERTLFATAEDSTRPVLEAVNIAHDGKSTLTLAAVDGFRVAVAHVPTIDAGPEQEFNLPKRTGTILRALLPKPSTGETVSIYGNGSQARFGLRYTDVVGQLVDATFPNLAQIIPETFEHEAVFNVGELADTVRSAAEIEGNRHIRFVASQDAGTLTIVARVEGLYAFEGHIAANVSSSFHVALNRHYILDVLRVLDKGALGVLQVNSPDEVVGLGPDGSDCYRCYMMPMSVNWEA